MSPYILKRRRLNQRIPGLLCPSTRPTLGSRRSRAELIHAFWCNLPVPHPDRSHVAVPVEGYVIHYIAMLFPRAGITWFRGKGVQVCTTSTDLNHSHLCLASFSFASIIFPWEFIFNGPKLNLISKHDTLQHCARLRIRQVHS